MGEGSKTGCQSLGIPMGLGAHPSGRGNQPCYFIAVGRRQQACALVAIWLAPLSGCWLWLYCRTLLFILSLYSSLVINWLFSCCHSLCLKTDSLLTRGSYSKIRSVTISLRSNLGLAACSLHELELIIIFWTEFSYPRNPAQYTFWVVVRIQWDVS